MSPQIIFSRLHPAAWQTKVRTPRCHVTRMIVCESILVLSQQAFVCLFPPHAGACILCRLNCILHDEDDSLAHACHVMCIRCLCAITLSLEPARLQLPTRRTFGPAETLHYIGGPSAAQSGVVVSDDTLVNCLTYANLRTSHRTVSKQCVLRFFNNKEQRLSWGTYCKQYSGKPHGYVHTLTKISCTHLTDRTIMCGT